MLEMNEINYDLKEDLLIAIRGKLPDTTRGDVIEWYKNQKFIKEITQESDFVYTIVLSNGEIIKATKEEKWRSWWVFEYRGVKYNTKYIYNIAELQKQLRSDLLPLEKQYEYLLKTFDWYYMFSDDYGVVCAWETRLKEIEKIKEKLIKEGKEDLAMELWCKYKEGE